MNIYILQLNSKNINQKNMDLTVELIAIELFKKDQNYEITLLFKNNAFITLNCRNNRCGDDRYKKNL